MSLEARMVVFPLFSLNRLVEKIMKVGANSINIQPCKKQVLIGPAIIPNLACL